MVQSSQDRNGDNGARLASQTALYGLSLKAARARHATPAHEAEDKYFEAMLEHRLLHPGVLSLKKWETLEVTLEGGAIIVTLPSARFRAVYYKPHSQPELVLRERTKTDDFELLAEVWKAANNKARELGWIV